MADELTQAPAGTAAPGYRYWGDDGNGGGIQAFEPVLPHHGGAEAVHALGTALSGTVTVDCANGNWQYGTLAAGTHVIDIAAGSAGYALGFTLELDATAGTATWGTATTLEWPGGTAVDLEGVTIVTFASRDGTTWRGGLFGASFGTAS